MIYSAQTPSTYKSPLNSGFQFEFVSAHTIYPYKPTFGNNTVENTYYQRVTLPDGTIQDNKYVITTNGISGDTYEGEDNGITLKLFPGVYTVYYEYTYPDSLNIVAGKVNYKTKTAKYTFYVVENQYPIQPMTVREVIDRLLDCIEPLVVTKQIDANGKPYAKYVKDPRFLFGYKYYDESKTYEENSPEGRAEYNIFNQTAPEFTFTKQTLREQMQEVGHFIHGEPRIVKRVVNGERRDVWIYDLYGEQIMATFKPFYVMDVEKMLKKPPEEFDIEEYLEYLDTLTQIGGKAAEFAEKALTWVGDKVMSPAFSVKQGESMEPVIPTETAVEPEIK